MTKTLKNFFELYVPKAKGEKDFVKKHVVVKHPDANGNGDEVFKASNVKTIKRSPEHGYDKGEDHKVYEAVEVVKNKRAGVITVHDGNNQSFPLHPEHQSRIRALNRGETASFKDETGSNVTAERTGALVHLKQDGSNRKVAVAYHHFKEGLEEVILGVQTYYEELGEDISEDDIFDIAEEIHADVTSEINEQTKSSKIEKRFTKEDVINSFIDKYVPIVENAEPETMEEMLVRKLEPFITESHIDKILTLFADLNEDNRTLMINHIEDEDSVNDVLNFVIENSVELDEDYKKVADLKSKGEYFAAGKHAAKIGHPRSYGPHFGMRSNLEDSKMEFFKGHDSVTYAPRKDKMTNEDAEG